MRISHGLFVLRQADGCFDCQAPTPVTDRCLFPGTRLGLWIFDLKDRFYLSNVVRAAISRTGYARAIVREPLMVPSRAPTNS
jgi:hypothetical protein